MNIAKEFSSHVLNERGQARVEQARKDFTALLSALNVHITDARCMSLVRTKLEEAAFFAVKGIALDPENQVAQ